MKDLTRARLLILSAVLPLSACAQCAPGKVGHGVSRLTIRNAGAVAKLILADSRCGFESAMVKGPPRVEGEIGKLGTLTYSVTECEVGAPVDSPNVTEDCNGVQTIVRGKVVVTARQVLHGILTGNEETPIIPAGPDSVALHIDQARFTEFSVETSASANVLTQIEGAFAATLKPRLAVDTDNGACSVPTANAKFEHVQYEPSQVHVKTDSRSFEVPVEGSDLAAVNGVHSGQENALWGEITVWGSPQMIDGAEEGLDPDYDATAFHASYACSEGMAQPTSFECGGFLAPILAQNGARLSIQIAGRLATMLEADTNCGFSSPEVLERAELMGEVGGFGTATLRVENCELNFPEETVVREDCVGTQTFARGRVVVSGTKAVTGRLTGDLETPVVPMSDAPAEITLANATFDGFTFLEKGSGLTVNSGQLSGVMVPRTAQDTANSNACAYVTSVARVREVSWDVEADVEIHSADSGTFSARFGQTRLTAVAGRWGADTNLLDGHITLDGEHYTLPVDPADDGLLPDYDQAAFDETWMCGTMRAPVSFECDFTAPLAQGASQLSIQMAGTLASMLDADTTCGFSSPGVVNGPLIEGELGRRGARATWAVDQPCRLDFGARTEVSRDCNGVATYASGVVELTGTKVIEGLYSGDPANPMVPTRRDPAEIRVDARFTNFAVWTDPETDILTARSGRMTAAVRPRTGIDVTTGACSLTTPVAQIDEVAWSGANVTLETEGKQFDLRLERSDLFAQNGNGDEHTNYLAGSIDMDGQSWAIPVEGAPILSPDYDQATFDASYACKDGLQVPADETACDLYQLLGENLARLVALSAGTIASEVNGNDDCGFEDFWVKTDPSRVEGDEGDMGLLEWEIDDCDINRTGSARQNPASIDCTGLESYWGGRTRIDASRTVTGIREDQYWIFDSIVPADPTSVTIGLEQVGLTDFAVWDEVSGEPSPLRGLWLDGGLLSGTVMPITGARADEPAVFDVATPVAHMTGLRLTGAPAEIRSGRATFRVFVDETDIEAFNGSYRDVGLTNMLRGHVVIDGVRVEFDTALDPAYDQAAFDQAYVCDGGLYGPIPPE